MASIKIPSPLRAYTGSQAKVSVSGLTVRDALMDLITQYPDLKQHICEGDALRSFVHVYLGDEDVRHLDGMETGINDDTELRIIPSIAGGKA